MAERLKAEGKLLDDQEAVTLLRNNGNALILGVLLDQQVRAEVAFEGPQKLRSRLGHLDFEQIASMDEDDLRRVFAESPAIHRFHGMMADRTKGLAQYIVSQYAGDASRLWTEANSELDFRKRTVAIPGFGPAKAKTLAHALELFGHRTRTST